jgi:hypothetical protein
MTPDINGLPPFEDDNTDWDAEYPSLRQYDALFKLAPDPFGNAAISGWTLVSLC